MVGWSDLRVQGLMSERTKVVVAPLTKLLDLSLRFARVQEGLYGDALAEAGKQNKFKQDVALRCVRALGAYLWCLPYARFAAMARSGSTLYHVLQRVMWGLVCCREKAGTWGTSMAVDVSEGDVRAARSVTAIAREYEPRVEQLSVSYHNQMMDLLVILEESSTEYVQYGWTQPGVVVECGGVD